MLTTNRDEQGGPTKVRPGAGSVIRKHPLVAFFVLAYAMSWWPWPLYAAGVPGEPFLSFGPLFAALIVIAVTDGRHGLRALAARMVRWRVGWRWYAVALALPLSVDALASVINIALGAPAPSFNLGHPWYTVIVVFAIRYRRRKGVAAEQIEGSTALEVTWSVIPLFIFVVIFVWGAVIYFKERTPPRGATEVYVVAKQWMWKLQHEEGQREINELHVPLGRDVKMILTSQDVIHSFYVPAFRIKQDVLPGRYTTAWFHPTRAGTYHLFCAEYCGSQHSGMIGQVVVLEPAQYESWLSGGGASGTMASNGQNMFQQLGCSTCHRFDTQGRGPNLVGLFGKPVQLEDGRVVTADENYIRESILTPGAKVVSGFKPIMPVFQGLVSEEQLNALVAYVKSLNPSPSGAAGGPTVVPSGAKPQETKVQ